MMKNEELTWSLLLWSSLLLPEGLQGWVYSMSGLVLTMGLPQLQHHLISLITCCTPLVSWGLLGAPKKKSVVILHFFEICIRNMYIICNNAIFLLFSAYFKFSHFLITIIGGHWVWTELIMGRRNTRDTVRGGDSSLLVVVVDVVCCRLSTALKYYSQPMTRDCSLT